MEWRFQGCVFRTRIIHEWQLGKDSTARKDPLECQVNGASWYLDVHFIVLQAKLSIVRPLKIARASCSILVD